jgi:hypothetical protein
VANSSNLAHPPRSSVRTLASISIVFAALVVVAGLVLAGWLLVKGSGSTRSVLQPSAVTSGVPSVLSARFVGLPVAGHDRDVLVGLGARRGGPVDVVVIPSDESVVSPNGVTVRLGAKPESGTDAGSCGPRCLRFPLRVLVGSPSTLEVTVDRPGKPVARVCVGLPARIPPSAERLFHDARSRMLGLHSLRMNETLGAGLTPPVVSQWSFQAPDRLQYTIAGGGKAVVIGTRRWDWEGGKWTESETSRLRSPAYPWQGARGARVVGRGMVEGKPVRLVAALKPGVDFPTWFLLYVAGDTRVLRSTMLTTGHFMVDTYNAFDSASPIQPPARRGTG